MPGEIQATQPSYPWPKTPSKPISGLKPSFSASFAETPSAGVKISLAATGISLAVAMRLLAGMKIPLATTECLPAVMEFSPATVGVLPAATARPLAVTGRMLAVTRRRLALAGWALAYPIGYFFRPESWPRIFRAKSGLFLK
jgi:hypothetical protein